MFHADGVSWDTNSSYINVEKVRKFYKKVFINQGSHGVCTQEKIIGNCINLVKKFLFESQNV